MDNDNKVNKKEVVQELKAKDFIPSQQVHEEVRMFLDSELASIYSKSKLQSYNLATEYAETKKHKSIVPLVILGLCFAVVLGTVVVMSSVISSKDRNIEVSMTVFDDLNLKDLLDSVSKLQDSYDISVKQRSAYINDRENQLRAAENKKEQDIFVVKSTKLTPKEEKRRIELIEKDYKKSIQEIEDVYAPRIAALDAEIRGYEDQLKQYDSSKVEAAQEQERLLNSERRVQELERRKLAQQYESRIDELEKTIEELRKTGSENIYKSVSSLSSKYQAEIDGLDPKIRDTIADKIVRDANSSKADNFSSANLSEEITDSALTSGLTKYQAAYNDYTYLNKIIASLPQKNTIPGYVRATKELVNSMGETFSETAKTMQNDKNALAGQIINLKSEIAGLTSDYDNLVEDYNGLVDDLEAKESELAEKQKVLEDYIQTLESTKQQFQTELDSLHKKSQETVQAQQEYFETCLRGIITSSKAMAAIISADSRDDIRIFVLPEVVPYITENGIPVEIKATKAIKGTLTDDGGNYYKFVPAVDKNGDEIPFDFSTVTSGLIVKLSLKK